ncbi:MAG TPA: FkbM family methyltransferase [Gemmataceae bacterium]|nr:FkbM family methyltransferase [Gemmataceae bacterium]
MAEPIPPDDHLAGINHFLDLLSGYVPPRGVIHVGAHQGQEVAAYLARGLSNILLVEANPHWCEYLKRTFAAASAVRVCNCAVTDTDGIIDLQMHTSRSGSTEPASIFLLKRFKEIVKTLHTPESVRVPATRLDSLFQQHGFAMSDYNCLNIDVQGAELLAFRGGPKLLNQLDAVLTEVNLIEMYEGCPSAQDIQNFLCGAGFELVGSLYHELYDETGAFPAWGECLFVRRELVARRSTPPVPFPSAA